MTNGQRQSASIYYNENLCFGNYVYLKNQNRQIIRRFTFTNPDWDSAKICCDSRNQRKQMFSIKIFEKHEMKASGLITEFGFESKCRKIFLYSSE